MISNLRHQLKMLGKENQMERVLEEIVQVRSELGYPIMVTPFAQFVGSQAAINVMTGERYKEVTDQVIQYALGFWGKEGSEYMEPQVKAKILDRPRARELEKFEVPELSLEEIRKKYGGPNLSDEELLLRFYAGPEFVDALKLAPPRKEYSMDARQPLVRLVRSSVASETWATSISKKVNFLYRWGDDAEPFIPGIEYQLASPVVLVVFALRSPSRTQLGGQRRTVLFNCACTSRDALSVQRSSSASLSGVHNALKHLELLAPGFFHHLRAPRPICLRQLRALSGRCGDRYNESDWHRVSSHLLVIDFFLRCTTSSRLRRPTINSGDHSVSLPTPSED